MFNQLFLVLTQLYCSSLIATTSFGSAVSPQFCPAFTGSFPHFSYKCLICRKSTFSQLFYSIRFSENTALHCLLVPNTLKIQNRKRSTLLQSYYFKRLLNVIAHTFYKIYPFIYLSDITFKNSACS